MSIITKTKSFLAEVYVELKKVNWLSRKELLKYTMIVIVVTFVVAALLGGLDYIFSTLIKQLII